MIVIVLLVLLLLLVLMIVVGHGIWVLIARLFRGPALPSHVQEIRLDLPRRCPMCRMLMPVGASQCPNCMGHRAASIPAPAVAPAESPSGEEAWDITARQVGRLLQAGLIDSATFVSLDSAIRSARTPLPPPPLAQLAPLPFQAAQVISPDVKDEVPAESATAPLPIQAAQVMSPEAKDEAPVAPPPLPLEPPPLEPPPLPRPPLHPQPLPRPALPFPELARPTLPPRVVETVPNVPKRPFSDVLASFMERKNIRWGELVGGLLIVGCSIALVLSFWAQIQQHPLMKFSIFTAVTAALFSLGLYSEHRWKLATTSRGILLTATLLIPLNFLAFAAFSHGVPATDLIALGGEVVAFALFFVLAWASAKVIVPQWPAWLTVGVMCLSAGTLAVRYLSVNAADAELPAARVLLLSAMVVSCYVATSGGILFSLRRNKSLDLAGANAALLSLAVLTFAIVFPLALIVARGADGSLHRIAPLIGLAGLPALAGGTLLRKRITEPALMRLRVVATGVSVPGAAVLLGGIVLAWPNPGEMLATSIIAFAAFFTIALAEGSGFWLGVAQTAASFVAAAAVVFCLDRGDATSDHTLAILADLATWRIIATLWAALSVAWAVLRRTAQRMNAPDSPSETDAAPAWGDNARMLAQIPFTFDRLMSALLLGALATGALLITLNGVLMELSPPGQTLRIDNISPQVVRAVTGPLPWLVLAMLLAAHLLNAWDAVRRGFTWPALVISWVACPLWAAGYSAGMAGGASAFRWGIAAWLLAAGGVVWWRSGSLREMLNRRAGLPESEEPQKVSVNTIDSLLLLLGVVPIVLLSVVQVGAIVFAEGPANLNVFHAVGPSLSYIVPLLAAMAFLLCQSTRHRSFNYAAAAMAISWLAGPVWAVGYSGGFAGGAPAFRWVTSAWLLLAAGVVWWRAGSLREILNRRAGLTGPEEPRKVAVGTIDSLLLMLGVMPIVLLSLFQVGAIVFADVPVKLNVFHAIGPSLSFIVPLLAGMAFLLCQSKRHRSFNYAAAGMAISWLAGPLWAVGYSGSFAGGAPAFRWVTSAWLLLAAGVVWWRAGSLREMAIRRLRRSVSDSPRTPLAPIDSLLLLLGVFPIVALSLFEVGAILSGDSGSIAPSLFHVVGPSLVQSVPLLALIAFLLCQSLQYRSKVYAVAGILAVNLLVTIVYAVATAGSGPLDTPHLFRLVQLNIATMAASSLAWILLWFIRARRTHDAPPGVLGAIAWTALAANLLLIAPAAGELFLLPAGTWSLSAPVGSIWGWMALGLSCVAAAAFTILSGRSPLSVAGLALPMIAALSALTATAWDSGNWLSFHVWMGAQTAAAWAVLALGWWFERRGKEANKLIREPALSLGPAVGIGMPLAAANESVASPPVSESIEDKRPATPLDYQPPLPPPLPGTARFLARGPTILRTGMLGLLAVALALRAGLGDPAAPWPSAAVIVFVGLLAAALAVWQVAPAALYAAAGLLNLAATLVYAIDHGRFGGVSALGFVEVNVAALALPAIAWLVLELQFFRRALSGRRRAWPIHQSAALASLALLGAAVGVCFVRALLGDATSMPQIFDVAAFVALAGLLVACLWDRPRVPALGLLYLFGLVACARWLECLDLPANRIAWAGALVLAGFGLLTSALYGFRGIVRPLAVRLGIPIAQKDGLPWLDLANLGLACAVIFLAFWSDFAFPSTGLRLLPSLAALAQVASLALLAGPRYRPGRKDIVVAALLVGATGLLAVGWAFLDPSADAQGLQHAALAAALMTAVALPLGLAIAGRPVLDVGKASGGTGTLGAHDRLASDNCQWTGALRAVTPILIVVCLASLAAALGLEACSQAALSRVEMPGWSIAAVAAAVSACCVAAVILALRPWASASASPQSPPGAAWKPAACVYAAEALLTLLFAHIRLHGYLERYWPLIVMTIAFAGVGLGEAFRRRGRMAFAGPLQNTGAFLPLIPVLAFWVASSQVHYTLLLLVAAGLYGTLAFLRKSTVFGLVAALAGNGSLWYLLNGSETLGFFAHPQVWVIPAALSGLAAVELNRARLSAAQIRTGRYFFVVALYLSSTADIFINATAHSTWLPLALAGLSVAGVLAGVALRVRPFLFLGTAFLTLSVIAMIYNAAASLNITWIWYVAGILLGLFIIVLFALFEKKRSTMLALVEGLKAWQ